MLWAFLQNGHWKSSNSTIVTGASAAGKSEITRLDFQTKRASHVTVLERPSFYGLTISPDVSSILYSQRDRDEHDVVITKLAD